MFNSLKQSRISKRIVPGIITGAILGSAAGYFAADRAIHGVVIGIILGGAAGFFARMRITRPVNSNQVSEETNITTFSLKEEQLDIFKKRVKTGNVSVHKEFVEEKKNIVVPTIREELVIQNKSLDTQDGNKANQHYEILRIPISEERVEIIKHPVAVNDVSMYKRQFHDTVNVKELCKKEKVVVTTTGNPQIIDSEKID